MDKSKHFRIRAQVAELLSQAAGDTRLKAAYAALASHWRRLADTLARSDLQRSS
jgi:hypothetical protein